MGPAGDRLSAFIAESIQFAGALWRGAPIGRAGIILRSGKIPLTSRPAKPILSIASAHSILVDSLT